MNFASKYQVPVGSCGVLFYSHFLGWAWRITSGDQYAAELRAINPQKHVWWQMPSGQHQVVASITEPYPERGTEFTVVCNESELYLVDLCYQSGHAPQAQIRRAVPGVSAAMSQSETYKTRCP